MGTERLKFIGINLKKARNFGRLSQVELAKKLKVSQPHLSKVETGHAQISVESLLLAAELFQVRMDRFLQECEEW